MKPLPPNLPWLVAPMQPLAPRLSAPLLTLLVLASALPGVATAQGAEDETSEVTFYGHIFGFGRSGARSVMPMNTQFPYGEADLSQGTVGHHCGTPDAATCEDDTGNEAWLYTTAGFVQIKNYEEFDYSKLHNERGLTKDTKLDANRDIKATFHMSADGHGWPIVACTPGAPRDVPWPVPCWNWDPGYLAQWQVEATLYTGVLGEYGGAADEAPDIEKAFADGKLTPLATGVSEPQDVQSLEPAGQPTVWKFDVNLGRPVRDTITKEESYVVRFKWWSLKPDGTKKILPGADVWNINSGEYYPPSITLPVKGAFNVEMVVPQFVYGKLVVLGIMNTPWGSYDVNQDSIQLTIENARSGSVVEPQRLERLADFSVAHGGHYKPVNVTYVWDYAADGLAPGDYKVTVSATNFQGSAAASCTGTFTVLDGGAPGPITVGQCGVRTITDEQLRNVQEGSAEDAQRQDGTPVPLPKVRLHAAAVEPVATVPAAPLALAMLALALLRRWSS